MFDVGFQEMLLIMVLALIVFGPSKLPELGKMIGRAMREFKRASDEFRTTVETNLNMNETDSPVPPVTSDQKPESTIAPPAPANMLITPASAPEDSETVAESGGVATERAVTGDPYWAQRGSRLFHSRECAWAARITEQERVNFKTVAEAKDQGYVACPVCEPWEVGFAP